MDDCLSTEIETLRRGLQSQTAIDQMLELVLQPLELEEILDRALGILLAVPWLKIEAKGCVFLVDEEGRGLTLTAQRGLAPVLLSSCGVIPFGYCLCGRVAESRTPLFVAHTDARHDVSFAGMVDHGHYCVPILFQGRLLGVLNTYVVAGHRDSAEEHHFLGSVARTLAGVIQRKRTEASLAEHVVDLERLVRERTQQLIHAERLATLGTFAAAVAHEINNPNGFISGNAGFLEMVWKALLPRLEGCLDGQEELRLTRALPEVAGAIEGIQEGSRRIDQIVIRMKGHAKAGTGTVKSPQAVRRLVEESLEMLRHKLQGVVLESEIPAEAVVVGNGQQLVQVLVNLINNAAEAMREARVALPRIGIGAQPVERGWRILVRDNGPGVSAEYAERIFSPFFTTKGATVGTGLGLFVVREIIAEHGGEIQLEPPLAGGGAGFLVTLPGG